MALHEVGSASNMASLVSALFTFATANGWTQDQLATGSGTGHLHKGNCFVSFRWNTGTPLHLSMYQALGYGIGLRSFTIANGGTGYAVGDICTVSGGTKTTAATIKVATVNGSGVVLTATVLTAGVNYTANPSNPASTTGGTGSGLTINCTFNGTASPNPGQSCDDSGNGQVTSTNSQLAENRGFYNIGNGAYPSYHFFTDASGNYIHIALEYAPGLWRHTGFGEIEKFGDWFGGEYCYGHTHISGSLVDPSNTCLLDALFTSTVSNTEQRGATLHLERLPNMGATAKWGICWASTLGGFTNDTAGVGKVRTIGGFRGTLITPPFAFFPTNSANGYIPLVPIAIWYWDLTVSPQEIYLLGFMRDVRMINISPYEAGEEITVDGETWIVFPTVHKSLALVTDESGNQGIAYKKNT